MKLPSVSPNLDALWKKHNESACKHPKAEVRKKITANGAVMIRTQCTTCGSSTGPARKKSDFPAEELAAIPPWNEELKNQYWRQRSSAYDKLRAEADEAAHAKWLKSYTAYLQTAEWKRKSALVLKRANRRCEGCLQAPATQAHHLTYEHVGEEFLFELVAVCDACHDRLHDDIETPEPS